MADLQAVGIEVRCANSCPSVADSRFHVGHPGIAVDFGASSQEFACGLVVSNLHDFFEGEFWNDYPDVNAAPAGSKKSIKDAVAGDVFVLNPNAAAARSDGFQDRSEGFPAAFKEIGSQNANRE